MKTTPDKGMLQHWNNTYAATEGQPPPPAAAVLTENLHLLPASGRALDLASGLGGNALLLAERGLDTLALDFSEVAIERLKVIAMAGSLRLEAAVQDVEREPPPENSFDVIVVSRFLERSLMPAITNALKPGGLLFYQTFTREKAFPGGPSNPDYLLGPNELLSLLSDLRLMVYREEGRVGDLATGFRNQAMLIGQKI